MSAYEHTPTARAVLRSLVPVICPPEASDLADDIVAHMALTFGQTPPLLRAGLVAGFAAYDLGALPRHRRRAHALPPDAAERYFASWLDGITPVHKQFARTLKQMMSLSCYEQPAMAARVGYRVGPWIEQVTRKRLVVFADDIARQEASLRAPDPLRPRAAGTKEVA